MAVCRRRHVPEGQADRWAQSTVAGCQRPTRLLSRGQRARAARAYLSGLHEDEPRRGAGLVGRPPGQYPGLGALDLQQAKEPPVSCESAGSAARG
jgi:hypothetical protein